MSIALKAFKDMPFLEIKINAHAVDKAMRKSLSSKPKIDTDIFQILSVHDHLKVKYFFL